MSPCIHLQKSVGIPAGPGNYLSLSFAIFDGGEVLEILRRLATISADGCPNRARALPSGSVTLVAQEVGQVLYREALKARARNNQDPGFREPLGNP